MLRAPSGKEWPGSRALGVRDASGVYDGERWGHCPGRVAYEQPGWGLGWSLSDPRLPCLPEPYFPHESECWGSNDQPKTPSRPS